MIHTKFGGYASLSCKLCSPTQTATCNLMKRQSESASLQVRGVAVKATKQPESQPGKSTDGAVVHQASPSRVIVIV